MSLTQVTPSADPGCGISTADVQSNHAGSHPVTIRLQETESAIVIVFGVSKSDMDPQANFRVEMNDWRSRSNFRSSYMERKKRLYYEELEYREKLFVTKQWKAERARKKEPKRRFAAVPEEASNALEEHLEEEAPSAMPVTMPDMVLPLSFNIGDPTHKYHCLDTAAQWLVRPVLDAHRWDNDNGYDGTS